MNERHRLATIATSIAALAVLTGCAGGGGNGGAENGTTASSAASTTGGSTVGGGSSTTDSAALPTFSAWPAEAGGFSTSDDLSAEGVTYTNSENAVVLAATVPDSFRWEDLLTLHKDPFEPTDNSHCGTFQGSVICAIRFSNRIVDFTAFDTVEQATTFVTAFVPAASS